MDKQKQLAMKIKFLGQIFLLFWAINLQAQDFKPADPKDMALFPQRNEFRDFRKISGIWKFEKDPMNQGVEEKWFNGLKKYQNIAVPGSWNDQFADMRDYRDWVWYETESYIPSSWKGQHIYIRIGEATFTAKVWVNGLPVGMHEGGFVPFAFDITSKVNWNESNRITIQVENSMKPNRLPGDGANSIAVSEYDIFPYAGLNRDVYLYSVPSNTSIKDITVQPEINGSEGVLTVMVDLSNKQNSDGSVVISGNGQRIEKSIKFKNGFGLNSFTIPNARLWSPEDPYLYEIQVIIGDKKKMVDRYALESGIRTVTTNDKHILLNGEPILLKGFGKQQDFPIYGRGTVYPVLVNDFELMKWMGANSFRTSDYPHDEICYDIADRQGFLIIGETPAVGLFNTNDTTDLRQVEKISNQYLQEMIIRDKNHPSIIMWSLANGPKEMPRRVEGDESKVIALQMFSNYINTARELDPTRLITYMGDENVSLEWFNLADVICINRFAGWTSSNGRITEGVKAVSEELDNIYKEFEKPCMLTQFGASTIAGAHAIQSEMYTEEFQKDILEAYLNMANSKDFVAGMLVSNFADYKTPQSIIRLRGYNTKGVLTRDRRPKAAAHFLKERWVSENENF